ncbi:MAG: hypothetical protein WDN30_03050 [Pararobbsia sp.]
MNLNREHNVDLARNLLVIVILSALAGRQLLHPETLHSRLIWATTIVSRPGR